MLKLQDWRVPPDAERRPERLNHNAATRFAKLADRMHDLSQQLFVEHVRAMEELIAENVALRCQLASIQSTESTCSERGISRLAQEHWAPRSFARDGEGHGACVPIMMRSQSTDPVCDVTTGGPRDDGSSTNVADSSVHRPRSPGASLEGVGAMAKSGSPPALGESVGPVVDGGSPAGFGLRTDRGQVEDKLSPARQAPVIVKNKVHAAVPNVLRANTTMSLFLIGPRGSSFFLGANLEHSRVVNRIHSRLFPQSGHRLSKRLSTGSSDTMDSAFGDHVSAFQLHSLMHGYGWEEFTLDHAAATLRGLSSAFERMNAKSRLHRFGVRFSRRHAQEAEVPRRFASMRERRCSVFSMASEGRPQYGTSSTSLGDEHEPTITFVEFEKALFNPDVQSHLSSDALDTVMTMKELLACGECNKLVSQLTRISIMDLTKPPPKQSWLEWSEPIFIAMIVLNGVVLAMQSDPRVETWPLWTYVDTFFVCVFLVELLWRIAASGFRDFFFGSEAGWNAWDLLVVNASLWETAIQHSSSATVLRIARLTRLGRLLRMLRFRMCRDLTRMLHGLLGGVRTLCWAMVLLFATIFVIALFMSNTIGRSIVVEEYFDEEADTFFGSVPRCMFTAFRCFSGDCDSGRGVSLASELSALLGVQFDVPYAFAVMFVNFGMFNLIIAVYIEATMEATKQACRSSKSMKSHNLMVAMIVKDLAKRIVYLERLYRSETHICTTPDSHLLEDFDKVVEVPKALFLMMLKDNVVEACLDKLGVPANRFNLFDVFDADGSGGLIMTELLQGLLATRGEPRKSDTVACLLSIRAMQSQVTEAFEKIHAQLKQLHTDRFTAPQLRELYANNKMRTEREPTQFSLPASFMDDAPEEQHRTTKATSPEAPGDVGSEAGASSHASPTTSQDGTEEIRGAAEGTHRAAEVSLHPDSGAADSTASSMNGSEASARSFSTVYPEDSLPHRQVDHEMLISL